MLKSVSLRQSTLLISRQVLLHDEVGVLGNCTVAKCLAALIKPQHIHLVRAHEEAEVEVEAWRQVFILDQLGKPSEQLYFLLLALPFVHFRRPNLLSHKIHHIFQGLRDKYEDFEDNFLKSLLASLCSEQGLKPYLVLLREFSFAGHIFVVEDGQKVKTEIHEELLAVSA